MKRKTIQFSAIIAILLKIGTGEALVAQTAAPPILAGYYVAVNGQSTGPYDASGLRQLIDRGQLTRNSLVWKEGMLNAKFNNSIGS
jgi:hypothetical protein